MLMIMRTRKTHPKASDKSSSGLQTIAASLICFIFVLHNIGLFTALKRLPEVDNHRLHNENSRTLHLSKYRLGGLYDDADDDSSASGNSMLKLQQIKNVIDDDAGTEITLDDEDD